MNPVVGWTTHHSICAIDEKWFLLHHGSTMSKSIATFDVSKSPSFFIIATALFEP